MAISFIGANGGGALNAGSVTVSLSGGTISGIAANDLIIVAYGNGDNDATNPVLAVTTAGYTAVNTTLNANNATNGDSNLRVFYKYHNGTDTNVVTTAAGTGTDSSCAVSVMVFRDVALAADGGPFAGTSQTASGTTGGDPNPPSITFTGTGVWTVIAGNVGSAAAPLTLTAPTNYTTNFDNRTGTDTFSSSTGLGYRTDPTSPEDPGVMTDSGTGGAWTAVTMALKAATITTDISITAGAETLTGQSIVLTNEFAVTSGAVSLAGQTSVVDTGIPITAGGSSLAGQTVTLTTQTIWAFQTNAFQNDAFQLEAAGTTDIPITAGAITHTGQSTQITTGVPVTNGAISETGQAVSVALTTNIPVTQGVITETGQSVVFDKKFAVSQGAITQTGQTISVAIGTNIPVVQGAITETGRSVGITTDIPISQGAVTLSRNTITVSIGTTIGITPGALSLSGQAVTFTKNFALAQGAVSLSGQTVGFAVVKQIAVSAGAVSLSGQAVEFTQNFGLAGGAIGLVGQDVSVIQSGANIGLPVWRPSVVITSVEGEVVRVPATY